VLQLCAPVVDALTAPLLVLRIPLLGHAHVPFHSLPVALLPVDVELARGVRRRCRLPRDEPALERRTPRFEHKLIVVQISAAVLIKVIEESVDNVARSGGQQEDLARLPEFCLRY
jgi:hypothetical protein